MTGVRECVGEGQRRALGLRFLFRNGRGGSPAGPAAGVAQSFVEALSGV